MRLLRNTLCAVLVLFISSAPFALSQSSSLHGIDLTDLDRKAAPCDDFFEFANGTWRANNPIPASMTRWSKRWQAGESSKDKLREILEAAAADKVIQGIQLPGARSHCVQEDVGILDDLEPRIDAPQLARIVHRPGESRAELTMRRAPSDDPGAEWTRVVERNFDVRAARIGSDRLRTEQRLDLRALQKIQNAFGNDDSRSAGVPR